MFLVLSNYLFNQILIVPHEGRQSILQPCNIVHAIDELIVAKVICFLPLVLGGGLELRVDEGFGNAFGKDTGEELLKEGDVHEEVLVHFDHIFVVCVMIAHQKIEVKIMLAS